jgi:UDP-2,3-diacylglucosamine pyrophosphatase LpxH
MVADTHIEDGNAYGLEKLADLVDGDSGIKFVIVIGDITQNAKKKDFDKFFEIAEALRNNPNNAVPCYPVIGNHDIYFGNWPHWRDSIGSTRYRIDSDETTLFVLDSANAFFGKAQLDWLERELKTARPRVFVFTHSNLFSTGTVSIQQTTDVSERARILAILKGRCDYMFMGHVHSRQLKEAGGVKYLSIDAFVDSGIYCRVTVKPAGISHSFEKL